MPTSRDDVPRLTAMHTHGTWRGQRGCSPMKVAAALVGGVVVLGLAAGGGRAVGARETGVDYQREVKPLFKQRCIRCHGARAQKGGLRLDTAAFGDKGGRTGPAWLAGQAARSLLIHVLRDTNPEIPQMPFKSLALPEADIALLAAWIDQGAPRPAGEIPQSERHWAFVLPVRPAEPAVRRQSWPRNPIDRFILARLEREGIEPSIEADRVTLLRRLSFDLVGLPPSPREVSDFVDDRRADAYERVVERLLSSPHFGERWARLWLDAARYADSNGYSWDYPRRIWKYRDWVTSALNRDLPFDQFIIWQVAGDLLPGATLEQKIATGLQRNTQRNDEGGIDLEQFRLDAVLDRVDNTGAVVLGLTLGCARCHDHKFDPISQRDYYRMAAFFNDADEVELETDRTELLDRREVVTTLALQQHPQPRRSYLFIKGDFTRDGGTVEPGTPAVLPPLLETRNGLSRPAPRARPTRLDLARWLVDPGNPLTARVAVNRLWQQYFGRGLVETDDDFGTQGISPSHPELLDWLATELVAGRFSMKHMHRLIVTSTTYRQSSRARPDLMTADPTNHLLARQSRLRLDAELVRDGALAASGLLDRRVGGPCVFPPQPDGVMKLGQSADKTWKTSTGPDRYRRGLYTFRWRSTAHPALAVFDAPDGISTCTRRLRSNTPLQALTLLNTLAHFELAQALGRRLRTEGGPSEPRRIDLGFRLAAAREPEPAERTRLLRLVAAERRAGAPEDAVWTAVGRVLLNLDETITRE